MLIKLGNTRLTGPGFIIQELSNKQNFSITNEGCDDGSDENEDWGFKVYAQQGCDIVRAYELYNQVLAELRLARSSGGRLTYYKNIDGYKIIREVMAGSAPQTDFELQYKSRRTVAFDLTINTNDSLLLSPTKQRNFSGVTWASDTIQAQLVMTNSTVRAQQGTAVNTTDFTTIDLFDGANYATKVLTHKTLVGGIYSADDISWPLLGVGTREIQGLLLKRSDNRFLGYIDASTWSGGTFNPTGDTVVFRINVYGLYR